MTRVTDRGR